MYFVNDISDRLLSVSNIYKKRKGPEVFTLFLLNNCSKLWYVTLFDLY